MPVFNNSRARPREALSNVTDIRFAVSREASRTPSGKPGTTFDGENILYGNDLHGIPEVNYET